jgi:hypothetical protein
METANGPLATRKASPAGTVGVFPAIPPNSAIPPNPAIPPEPDSLSAPLESLLASGGDARLNIDPVSRLNRYSCRSWPNPEALSFASSTASGISERGFAAAAAALRQLRAWASTTDLATACDRQAERLRAELIKAWLLDRSGVEIVFSPSGTDSEVHALFVAQALLGGPLVNVIVAADETGSGLPEAASGRHFSSCTGRGVPVLKGEKIPGFFQDNTENTNNISIPLRAEDGEQRSNGTIDRAVAAAVSEWVASGRRVVLHAMDSSKFGWRGPTSDCLSQIQKNCRGSVQVLVDACQMRLSRARLRHYLCQGFMVLITGSKYFAGPSFSGALLVPAAVSAVMERMNSIPDGLRLYSNASDWPVRWRGVRAKLPSAPNVGQLLRWCAALEEMRAYFDVPVAGRCLALHTFAATMEELLAGRPNLQLLPACEGPGGESIGAAPPDPAAPGAAAADDEEMAIRTTFPFFLRRHGKLLPLDDCARIYRALPCDMSHLLPDSAPAEQRHMAAAFCQIGQPTPVQHPSEGTVGTLRISASARVVSETWRGGGETAPLEALNLRIGQVRLILDKIDLVIENLEAPSGAARA